MAKFSVNKLLLPMKIHFFLYNGGTAPVVPFMPTYAKQLGFSSVVVGALYTALPVAGMIAKPLFGGIADRLSRHKTIFLIFLALTGILFVCLDFVPPAEQPAEPGKGGVDLDCGAETLLKSCNRTDNCALTRLQLASTAHDLKSVNCIVHCPQVSFDEWGSSLCKSWGLASFCKASGESELLFTAKVSLAHTDQIEDCLYLRVMTAIFDEASVVPVCNKTIRTKHCQVECRDAVVNEVVNPKTEGKASTTSASFGIFSTLLLTSWIAMAVVVSLGDAICFDQLAGHPEDYGRQRVWGSVGWGIFSVLAGFLVDEASKGQTEKNYSVVFYLALAVIAVDFLVCTRVKVSNTGASRTIVRDVGRLLLQVRIVAFLIWCVVIGMCTGLLWSFLFWHLEELAAAQGCDSLEWIKTLEGLVMGVQCFGGELPFFFLSGWFLRKLGHVHTMSVVLLAFGVRFLLYYFLVNPWWVLPIELLNGLTFGLFYAAMASYASKVAPPGAEATMQGLVGAVFEGVGLSLGSLVGGLLFQSIGGAETFLAFSGLSFLAFLLHFGFQFLVLRHHPQEPTRDDDAKELATRVIYTSPGDALEMLDEPGHGPITNVYAR